MANNRDLLKEAIADAKALKETAIANAKAALEEAFEPRLKSMLSAKLQEMEEEDLDEVVTTEAKEEVEERLGTINDPEGDYEHGNIAEEEEMDEEMDLDEILAELEEGEDKEDMKEAKEEIDEAKEEIDEAEEMDEAEDKEEDESEDEAEEGEEEDEEIDLEEMTEEDLKNFIEDVIADMVEAGELEAGEGMEDEEGLEDEMDIEIDAESEELMEGEKEEIDEAKEELDEAMSPEVIAMLSAALGVPAVALAGAAGQAAIEKSAEKGNKVAQAVVKAMQTMGAAGKAGGSGIKEADDEEDMMEEVNALRAELHEVNLLNAKLLYTNKIFRAKNLKEAQKVKVLESFDKATSVKEVKLVFETLSEGIKETTKSPIKESLSRASKPAGVAPSKSPIVDVDPQVARWQKLAGIR